VPWWYAVAERDHTIQNPTSDDKIRLLGERLRLTPTATVLDVACGKAGPAVVLSLGLPGTLSALTPGARSGGHVVVGEPYWRRWPLSADVDDEGFVSLAETANRFADAELELVGLIASSEDDWDRYETLHWQAVEEWLAEHPDDPDAPEFRRRNARYRDDYLQRQRELLGWAIFIARKR
jgi:hypothetical protein